MSRCRLIPSPAQEAAKGTMEAPGLNVRAKAGHAVTARGGHRDAGPVNREPQLLASFAGR